MLRDPLFVDLVEFNISNVYDKMSSLSFPRIVLVVFKKKLDIGSLTYRNRFAHSGKAVRLVDVSSYDPIRSKAISGWLVSNVEVYLSGKSLKTFVSKFRQLVNMVDAFDKLQSNPFDSCDNLNEAYANYRKLIGGLKHSDGKRYKSIETRLGVASEIMDAFCKALDYKKYPVKAIRSSEGEVKNAPTLAPQQNLVAECLALSFSLFSEIFRLLSTNANYPMLLQLPKEEVWLFPIRQFCASTEMLNSGKPTIERNVIWNYREGRINTPEEMERISIYRTVDMSKKRYFLRSEYQKALNNIGSCNSDSNCVPRRRLLRLAQDAYVVLFSAVTGLNESVLRELEFQPEWSDEKFEGERGEIGFRGMKARAGNGWVNFKITNEHMKYFKLFVRLRELICNGDMHPYFFVAMDADGACLSEPVIENLIIEYFRRLRSFLYPKMRAISYRQWRKYKFDNIIDSIGVVGAASALQHTQETSASNYMEQTAAESALELSTFLRNYANNLQEGGRLISGIETPAGGCEEHGVPRVITAVDALLPDCKNFLGCLFCDSFLLHATDVDIRKLLSMRFFLEKVLPMSRSLDSFKLTAGKTLQQIDEFLNILRNSSSDNRDLVEKVQSEVYGSQALSPYWQKKLFFLSGLDLI